MTDQLSLDELLKLGKKVKEWSRNSDVVDASLGKLSDLDDPGLNYTKYSGLYNGIIITAFHGCALGTTVYRISASCRHVKLGESKRYRHAVPKKFKGDEKVYLFYESVETAYCKQFEMKQREIDKEQNKLLKKGPQELLRYVKRMLK